MTVRVTGIFRYPVKGLAGEVLHEAALVAGRPLAGDRRFAFAPDGSAFDAARPQWLPKRQFLQLAQDPALTGVRAVWDDAGGSLRLAAATDQVDVVPDDPADRARAEAFLDRHAGTMRRQGQRLVSVSDTTLSDTGRPFLSILNQASVASLAAAAAMPIEVSRFRGNLVIDGLGAWAEFDCVGSEIMVGSARLKVVEPIGRCIATHVNPSTGSRDINMLKLLADDFGHTDCGVYAEIVADGYVRVGDSVVVPAP